MYFFFVLIFRLCIIHCIVRAFFRRVIVIRYVCAYFGHMHIISFWFRSECVATRRVGPSKQQFMSIYFIFSSYGMMMVWQQAAYVPFAIVRCAQCILPGSMHTASFPTSARAIYIFLFRLFPSLHGAVYFYQHKPMMNGRFIHFVAGLVCREHTLLLHQFRCVFFSVSHSL